ncbi:MAG: alpha/beta hydrolase [Trueperaceae bacterium]
MSTSTWRLTTNDGAQLYVEEGSGGAQGRLPVLLVNGVTMSTDSWNLLGRLLQPQRTVLRYDMRGQGASDAPVGPYRRERHARDLLALLADLDQRGLAPLHVVALSNGGYVSQLLLAWLQQPELALEENLTGHELEQLGRLRGSVASLTLLDTFAAADARLQAAVRAWLGALATGGAAARFDAATPWVWGPEFLAANAKALSEARDLAADHPQESVRWLLEGLLASAAAEPDLQAALTALELPLLVAVGEDDVLTPVRNHREVLQQFGRDPAEVQLIARAGHAAPIENAEGVAALIRPFFDRAEAARNAGDGRSEGGVTAM